MTLLLDDFFHSDEAAAAESYEIASSEIGANQFNAPEHLLEITATFVDAVRLEVVADPNFETDFEYAGEWYREIPHLAQEGI